MSRFAMGDRPSECTQSPLPVGSEFFEQLVDSLYDGVYFVDVHRRILYWNKGAERIAGYGRDEVVGQSCFENLLDHVDPNGCHLCRTQCPLANTIRDGEPRSARVSLRHKDGRRIPVDVHVMPMRERDGRIRGAVEVFRDARAAVGLEHAYTQLQAIADRDFLTGVTNRRALDTMLADQLDMLANAGIRFSVVMIDLDHFKRINDTWGHAVGDDALRGFARLLESVCRNADIVGRFGGEEFLVIMPATRLTGANLVAERIRAAVSNASLPGHMTASLGVAEAAPGDTPLTLLARADAALYRAKSRGRNRVELQNPAATRPCTAAFPEVAGCDQRELPTRDDDGMSRCTHDT